MTPALPPAYAAFLEHFAAAEYWEAHEVLEGAWREGRSGFYKGLILLASAFVHAGRGNAHGVGAQMMKAERELAPYAPRYMGQDVEALLDLARRGRSLADRAGTPGEAPPEWRAALPPPDLTPDPGFIRGDEPELS